MRREEWLSSLLVIAGVLLILGVIKISWKYNAFVLSGRIARLEQQNEIMRQVISANGLLPADSDMQKKWDKTFTEGDYVDKK
jgi:hypothetical protein